MLMQMIGKLSKDQKMDWPKHLQELIHIYNCMRLTITRLQLILPDVWALTMPTQLLLFLTIRGNEKDQCVDICIVDLCIYLWETFKEVQMQSTSEAER